MSLKKRYTAARFQEQIIESLLFLCALLSIITTAGIILVMFSESVFSLTGGTAFFQEISPWEFFTSPQWSPQFAEKHFGVLPLLCGTVLVAGIAALTGLPLGILGAIYLSEYATPKVRKIVKPFLEILAGIPTVVYGYFALEFITPFLLKPFFTGIFGLDVDGFNALSAGLVVGIMIIPMVCSLSEDALRSVPRSLREAGYALGSTKFDVSVRVVVPAATSGIIASFLLAISRAIGETMAVVIAAGQSPVITMNPLKSIQTMTAFMVNISLGDTPAGSIEYKSLYAVGLTLFFMTLAMNVLSQWWMRRFREVYQ
ncbi:phosphate ABC transporter permease subunit PstC [Planctomicrobium sp. SH527]|uniref:phosphate ABC transporter permease subunit PstC n=1 Tax=Planctomicrobium sp. SH527 TaxID=3448123 RepID=UPI003F5B500A